MKLLTSIIDKPGEWRTPLFFHFFGTGEKTGTRTGEKTGTGTGDGSRESSAPCK